MFCAECKKSNNFKVNPTESTKAISIFDIFQLNENQNGWRDFDVKLESGWGVFTFQKVSLEYLT